ncbi:MAG: DUF5105 domain-containing protein [Bacillota bacterium]|nr:DUF5105 domain-containing protein [Bacillota bacterium]
MKKNIKSIIGILLAVSLVFGLVGCGEVKKAESSVNGMFTALKSSDLNKAQEYINLDELNLFKDKDKLTGNPEVFMKALFSKLGYTIISSEKIDSNTVVVKTKITAVDMKPVLKEFISKAMQFAFQNAFAEGGKQLTDEELNKKYEQVFIECTSKKDLAMVTNTVDIKVVNVDGNWKIKGDDALVDALLGGLKEASDELKNSFNLKDSEK